MTERISVEVYYSLDDHLENFESFGEFLGHRDGEAKELAQPTDGPTIATLAHEYRMIQFFYKTENQMRIGKERLRDGGFVFDKSLV